MLLMPLFLINYGYNIIDKRKYMFKKEYDNGVIHTVESGFSWPDSLTWIEQNWKNIKSGDRRDLIYIESKEALIALRDQLTYVINEWDAIDKQYDEDMKRRDDNNAEYCI